MASSASDTSAPKKPSKFEQKLGYNVDRFAKILLDEQSEEDQPLVKWLKESYGEDKTAKLQALQFQQLSINEQRSHLKQFLEWFRQTFPYYRDQCDHCQAKGCQFQGNQPPSLEERDCSPWIDHTEVSKCPQCHQLTRFPRYLAAMEIVKRKRGRCSEYSLLVYRILRALGHFRSRWIVDWANHVWAEIWMDDRWVHLDPCEAALDTPYLYQGWGKKQTYIVAFEASSDNKGLSVVDVTHEYTKESREAIEARRIDDVASQKDIIASMERANKEFQTLSLAELVQKRKNNTR